MEEGTSAANDAGISKPPCEPTHSIPVRVDQESHPRHFDPGHAGTPGEEAQNGTAVANDVLTSERPCEDGTNLPAPLPASCAPARGHQDDQNQYIEPSHAETPNAEVQNEKAAVNPSKKPKRVQQTTAKKPPRSPKNELLDPKKFQEEMVMWCLDNWRARACVVYENDQLDGTSLWSPTFGQEGPGEGISIFDGFSRTWFVPIDDRSPLPLSKRDIVENLQKRQNDLMALSSGDGSAVFFGKVRLFMEQEVRTMCQSEWDGNKNKPNLPSMDWTDAKSKLTLPLMLRMAAKTRLIDGRALLPGYYRMNVVELTTEGKLIVRNVCIPPDVDMEGVRLRLNTWFPVDDEQTQEVFKAVRKKLNIALQHGNDVGKNMAQGCLRDLKKSQYSPEREGAAWVFKLHVRENYTVPPGKGPGRLSSWTELKDEDSYRALKEGVRAGKHPVAIRSWKVQLRRMWPRVDELEYYLLPAMLGEPELTSEQLVVLDSLLAEQTDEAREQGRQMARVLSWLDKPTYHLEFAERDDCHDLGKEGLDGEPSDVEEE
ncbi:hypothetical protein G7Z17_g4887 [Cylindrodendrum hubeiense]|uniref:Uncharacterized protein n=1 Tax=Cylindrodendrum hubeiense TaxID=595255 RepID=A0A9P5LHW7_9HYPO|nr:hypothetical protein G7Z17_g4887 [Cylindrodendrum hubeiense]